MTDPLTFNKFIDLMIKVHSHAEYKIPELSPFSRGLESESMCNIAFGETRPATHRRLESSVQRTF